ncbi:MAG: hypothetical protein AB1742_06655 [bacterium]
MKVGAVIIVAVFILSLQAAVAESGKKKEGGEKKKTAETEKKSDKKEEGEEIGIWKYDLAFGTDFESSRIDNTIYKPEFSIAYKRTKKSSVSLKLKLSDDDYTRTHSNDRLKLDMEWKKKFAGGDVKAKIGVVDYPRNRAKDAVDYTLEASRKFNKMHASTFSFTYSPDFYGGRSKLILEDGEEEGEDEEEEDEEEEGEEEDAETVCRNLFEEEIAEDDDGNPLCVDGECGLTWWEYYYEEGIDDGMDDDEATDYADEQEDLICAQSEPVIPGRTDPITQIVDIRGKTMTYVLGHTYSPDKMTSLNLKLKRKDVSTTGSVTGKDRNKEVDTVNAALGFDRDINKRNKLSFDFDYEKGRSAIRNMGISPDNSYREYTYRAKFSNEMGEEWKVYLDAERSDKKYTTSNPVIIDKNFGRRDDGVKYGLMFKYEPNKELEYTFGYRSSDKKFRKLTSITKADVDTYSVSVQYRF